MPGLRVRVGRQNSRIPPNIRRRRRMALPLFAPSPPPAAAAHAQVPAINAAAFESALRWALVCLRFTTERKKQLQTNTFEDRALTCATSFTLNCALVLFQLLKVTVVNQRLPGRGTTSGIWRPLPHGHA